MQKTFQNWFKVSLFKPATCDNTPSRLWNRGVFWVTSDRWWEWTF